MFYGPESSNSHSNSHPYGQYSEPPHSVSSDSTTTSPMDMYTMPTTGFEHSLYAEAPYNMNHNPTSPGLYTDEGELRMPSSSLSTASASSSAIGSPQSNPGRSAPGQEWNAQYQPSIVGNDYMSPEYAGYPIEEQPLAYDFTHTKGFVGESPFLFPCHHFSSASASSDETLRLVVPGDAQTQASASCGHPDASVCVDVTSLKSDMGSGSASSGCSRLLSLGSQPAQNKMEGEGMQVWLRPHSETDMLARHAWRLCTCCGFPLAGRLLFLRHQPPPPATPSSTLELLHFRVTFGSSFFFLTRHHLRQYG